MSFEARVFIQGTGQYVPHENNDQLIALFPNSDRAEAEGVLDIEGNPICRHHAVLQFSSKDLAPGMPDMWTTIDVEGHWIGVDSDSDIKMALGKGIPGIPAIDDLLNRDGLSQFIGLEVTSLPFGGGSAQRLRAGLYVDRGVISPHSPYMGKFDVFGGFGKQLVSEEFSSVLKLELGEVNTFAFRLRRFGSKEVTSIALNPTGGHLDVWVRHFCDLRKPDPKRETPDPEAPDLDFALNYSLQKDLFGLIAERGNRLPVPKVWKSWSAGGPIGGDPRMCMGTQGPSQAFRSPFSF